MVRTAEEWIEELGLQAHPEGGWYKETYRSTDQIGVDGLKPGYGGSRSALTAIYYLLQKGERSAFHRLLSDEVWCWHAGGGLRVVQLAAGFEEAVIDGASPQLVIPSGRWFGATPTAGSDYCLVSCLVAPGFDFADFELADRQKLCEGYPSFASLITEFT